MYVQPLSYVDYNEKWSSLFFKHLLNFSRNAAGEKGKILFAQKNVLCEQNCLDFNRF